MKTKYNGSSRYDMVSFVLGGVPAYTAEDAHRLFCDVVQGDDDAAASLFGVSASTARRWRMGECAVPTTVFWLLKLAHEGQLPPAAGGFAGWWFCRRNGTTYLVPPGADPVHGISPAEIQDLRQFRLAEAEHNRLRRLVVQQAELIEELQKQRDHFRRQVQLEASLGLMLSRLTY